MAIYVIGDLHLSHGQDKPMDLFGDQWESHPEKIMENWNRVVEPGDLVVIAGDISWAMRLTEAALDFKWLESLAGTKLLIKGNHDYWWSSISKVRAALPPSIYALQNDHFHWKEYAICGTRGWICPGEEGFSSEDDQKIYLREVERLRLSLESAVNAGLKKIVVVLHFPPFNRKSQPSAFTDLLEEFGVEICAFGHIHDDGREYIFQGLREGVSYRFAAADGISFTPLRLV
jgi:uncharacterized protein